MGSFSLIIEDELYNYKRAIYLLLFLSIMPEINLYYLFLLNFGHKGNNKYK